MDLLELIAGVQEDVENAPVETARMELVFDRFFRLTGLDIGLQTKILADALSGVKAPSWCWAYHCKQAGCELYSWLDKNGGTSLPNTQIVDNLIDWLRSAHRTTIFAAIRSVLEAHVNQVMSKAMQIHTDLTTDEFYQYAGEAMQMLQRNALSMAVRNYVAKRREEEKRLDDIALMAT